MGRPGTPGPRSVDDDGQAHNGEDISVKALRVQFKYLVGQYSKRRWLDEVGWYWNLDGAEWWMDGVGLSWMVVELWFGAGWNLDGVG